MLTVPPLEVVAQPKPRVVGDAKVAVTPFNERLRLAGTMEFGGLDEKINQVRVDAILRAPAKYFRNWEPPVTKPTPMAGMRPMTPDGPPYLGKTRYRNLYLNVGQGSNGWTQACGCGRVVADIVSGRRPDIDLDGLGVDR